MPLQLCIMKDLFFEALKLKYQSEIASSKANLAVYLEKSVGVGEHSLLIEEMDSLIAKITESNDKLKMLEELSKE